MADKLLPCPFCGGEAEWFYIVSGGAWVGCKDADSDSSDNPKCLIRPFIRRYRGDEEKSLEIAISDWNNRPSNWHTGTPTEEGWYLIKYKHNGGIRYIAMENPSKWVFINDDTLEWQKIEEGEEVNG